MNFFSIQINTFDVWMIKQQFDNFVVSFDANYYEWSSSKTVFRIKFNT